MTLFQKNFRNISSKIHLSLDFKITLIFVSLALIPFLGVFSLTYRAVHQHIRRNLEKELTTLVGLIRVEIGQMVQSTLSQTEALARNPYLINENSPEKKMVEELKEIQDFYGLFDNITLVSKEGHVLASTSYEYRGVWKDKSWFTEALKGKAIVSPVHVTMSPFRLIYITAAPIFSEAGEVRALITGQVTLNNVVRLTHQMKVGETDTVFIMNDEGYLIDHPDHQKLLYKLEPLEINKKILSSSKGFMEFTDRDGVAKVCAFMKMSGFESLGNHSWHIGIIQDRKEAFLVAAQLKNYALLLVLGGALIIFVFAMFLSGVVVKPVKELAVASLRIADGDLDTQVNVTHDDEIGELAKCLNKMIRKLRFSRGELIAEKERLNVTLRSITDAVVTIDNQGRIILLSEAAEKLCGVNLPEVQGKPFIDIFQFADNEQKKIKEDPFIRQTKENNFCVKSRRREFRDCHNKMKTVSFNAAPINDKSGECLGTVVVMQDVTAEERIREELNKIQKLETIGVLAGGIAHDFNNILTSIVGNISLAKFDLDPRSEIFNLLTEVEKTSMEAKQLTQQLLAFSKGGAPVKKVTNLGPFLEESINFVSRGSNVICEYKISANLWPAEIDPGQIRQVLHNLAINAIQAMPKGGKLEVAAENALISHELNLPLTDGVYVKISIKDEGTGISEENLSKVFDPFFTTKPSGNGLGLAGSFSIIKKHAGYIAVSSQVNKGTTFSVYLPATIRTVEGETPVVLDTIKGEGHVLVMDDESVVRKMFGQYLFRFGFEVLLTTTGDETVRKFREMESSGSSIQLVILDLTIRGGLGGVDTLKEIRKINPGVKAVVTSGYATDPVMADYKNYGFQAKLTKPFTFEELNNVIKEALYQA